MEQQDQTFVSICKISSEHVHYYLLRGGYLVSSSLYDAGSYGYYWSSTPTGSSAAYYLYFYSGNVATSYSSRYGGRSVCCVAAG